MLTAAVPAAAAAQVPVSARCRSSGLPAAAAATHPAAAGGPWWWQWQPIRWVTPHPQPPPHTLEGCVWCRAGDEHQRQQQRQQAW